MTDYQRAHRNALDVQDACNLVAVVNQFQRDLKALRDEPTCTGTDWIRAHAVVLPRFTTEITENTEAA